MKKLSKEKFIYIIDTLKVESDTISELYQKYKIDIIDCDWYKSDECLIDLLKFIFDDKEDWIDWWCWETDFGRDTSLCVLYDDENNETVLDTTEKFYDFLVDDMGSNEWLS